MTWDEYNKQAGGAVQSSVSSWTSLNARAKQNYPKPQPPQIPSAVQNFPGTIQKLSELQLDPLSLKANPFKALSAAVDSLKNSFNAEVDNISSFFGSLGQKHTPAERTSNLLRTATGAVGIVLSPITALFSGAEQIPVLGSVSKLINTAFTATGEGGALIGDKLVDSLPVSQQTKDQLKPGIKDVFALASQIVLGKAVAVGDKKYQELTSKYGKEDATTIINKANELAQQKTTIQPAIEKPVPSQH